MFIETRRRFSRGEAKIKAIKHCVIILRVLSRMVNSCGSKAGCARSNRGVSKVWATPPGVENGAPLWQLHRQINQEVNIL